MSEALHHRIPAHRVYVHLWLLWPGLALGDTAEMLPPGVSHVRYQYTSAQGDTYFDEGGDRRALGSAYREALQEKGLEPEVSGVYRVDTDGHFSQIRHDLYFEYGINSSVNFGLWTHYVSRESDYSARLSRQAGWDFALSSAQQAGIGGAVTVADHAKDGSVSAPGDTVLGLKHRLIGEDNDAPLRFAYTIGLRLPTGHVADPLEPHDSSVGDGQTDAGIWFAWDWEPNERWLFNLHTRHEYQFEGERDEADPTRTHRVSMEFQPGVYHYAELSAHRRIPRPGFNGLLVVKAIYETEGPLREQPYDAATGRYRGSLETVDGTDSMLFRLEPQIGFNLFPRGIPVAARLYYGIPLRGKNTLATDYLGVRFDIYW